MKRCICLALPADFVPAAVLGTVDCLVRVDSLDELFREADEPADLICWDADTFAAGMRDRERAIRDHEGIREAANIAFGSDGSHEALVFAAGGDDFILLPCDEAVAALRVRNAVAKKNLVRSAREQTWDAFMYRYCSPDDLLYAFALNIQTGSLKRLRATERAIAAYPGIAARAAFDDLRPFIHPADVESVRPVLTGQVLDYFAAHGIDERVARFRLRNGEGYWTWVETRVTYMGDIFGGNRCFGYLRALDQHDVTAEVFRQALADTAFAIMLIRLGADTCTELLSPLGSKTGQPICYSENYRGVLERHVLPDDLGRVMALLDPARLAGVLREGAVAHDRFSVRLADGRQLMLAMDVRRFSEEDDALVLALKDVTEVYDTVRRQADAELARQQRQHAQLLESVLDFSGIDYCEYVPATDTCTLSARSISRYGISGDVFPNYRQAVQDTQIIYDEDKPLFLEMLRRVSEGQPLVECVVRMRNLEAGGYVWTRYRCRTTFDEGGAPLKAMGVGVVVEDYKRIEQSYVQMCLANGIAVLELDIASCSFKRNAGYGSSEHLGLGLEGISDVHEHLIERGRIAPEDVEAYRDMFRRVRAGERSVQGRIRRWSYKLGRFLWFEYHFILTWQEGSVPMTSLVTVRDVSAEVSRERRYREEESLRDTLDSSIIAYCRLNLSRGVVEDATLALGTPVDDPTMLPVDFAQRLDAVYASTSLTADERQSLSAAALEAAFKRGIRRRHLSYWATIRENGRVIWVETDCRLAERGETGEAIAFFYNRDRTARRLRKGLLEDLAEHSFERAAAVFLNTQALSPIVELTASYSPYWDAATYDQGISAYCHAALPPETAQLVAGQLQLSAVLGALERQASYTVQYDIRSEEGELRRKQTEFSYLDRQQGVLLVTRTDVALYEKLRYLIDFDPLTGLYSRSKLFRECRALLDGHPEVQFAFAHYDISSFNLYNSSFGEDEGDRLLRFAADMLRENAAQYDLSAFGRVNADVFCLLAPYDQEKIERIARVGNKKLGQYREDYSLQFSSGVYVVEDPSMSVEEICAKADMAAKRHKSAFDGAVGIYDAREELQQRRELLIGSEMRGALLSGQFQVYLQPKYHVSTNQPMGAEALVRWAHPQRGLVSPGVFIPVFERNGFIAELDRHMWRQVCQLLRTWVDAGLDPKPVSVNVSRISLYNPNLASVLTSLVQEHSLPPRLLELEITESAYMSNPEMMRQTIDQLHDAGFTILMDDFGSGYSSLNTLKDFPVDILKIDMKFLPKDRNVRQGEVIISSVVQMARLLGMKVIMEGVETEDERDFLSQLGCDCIQGFFYARPMPAADYAERYVQGE